ncbi:MAG: selenium-dependent molybdenum cofactor biosynthesis protein YqeB [Desulfotomaculaceae bacterium]|nr:selenium-dependent molybdenum cofactor biosynthesis protein YqeB [Desulfotomaculaceae bacterium]
MQNKLVVIRGAGEVASGAAHRLVRSGFSVAMIELPEPLVVRQKVSFAEAVFNGKCTVEDITAELAVTMSDINKLLEAGRIPIVADPSQYPLKTLRPTAVIDATMAKKNIGTTIGDAPVVIGLGPGFTAGVDVHAVVETQRGHDLGRVILHGQAEPNTGIPGNIGGYSVERVLRSPGSGTFNAVREIGDSVEKGEFVATVDDLPLYATISGVLRGLLHNSLKATPGMKVGDIDPRRRREYCFTISDKARAIAGGVLEAYLFLQRRLMMWS